MIIDAFKTNRISEGTVSHRVHGLNADIPATGSHTFIFVVPYTMAKLTGVEVVCKVCNTSNMTIKVPNGQGGYITKQYGFDVNIGEIVYTREAGYAADLSAGYEIEVTVNNSFNESVKMGVNFILHEVKLI